MMTTSRILTTLAIAMAIALAALASSALLAGELDVGAVARLPMLDNGRIKPFDTYARETIRFLTDSERFQGRDPVTLLLELAFDSKGASERPLLSISFQPLKEKLGLKREVKFVSSSELASNPAYLAMIERARTSGKDADKLPRLEKEAVILYHKSSLLEEQHGGLGWKLMPNETNPEAGWLSAGDSRDASTEKALAAMGRAYVRGDGGEFDRSVAELSGRLRALAVRTPYPEARSLDREVWYHRFRPFEKASLLYGLSFLAFLICSMSLPRRLYKLALALGLAGFAMHTYGIALRVIISGRPPVSNVYETMLWVPFGINLFALIFELAHRARFFGMVASGLGAGILMLSDYVSLDPYVSPLVPVLRSNYWLIIHVLTITLGYAAATLAMGLAHIWLAIFVWKRGKSASLASLEKHLYHTVQVTVLLIAAGTILGGVWANQSWGRYWGWDPKETWALISLLGYLAIVHARVVNAIGGFGTAASSVAAWQLVLFCWYGVNYFLTGLHSYAGGGQSFYVPWQVFAWAAFEAAFLAVAWSVRRRVSRSVPKTVTP